MSEYTSYNPAAAAEEKVAFLLSLRERGIRDMALLRAMEIIPRELFSPRRLSDLARADISLPLPCGQTMTAPSVIANMITALKLKPEHRVFEVGAGSGYVSAVLGHMTSYVFSVERYRTLALAASERIATLGLSNIMLLPADGLAAETVRGQQFDRILLNGTLTDEFPPSLLESLKPGGCIVSARMVDGICKLMRVTRRDETVDEEKPDFSYEILNPLRMPPLTRGVAKVL